MLNLILAVLLQQTPAAPPDTEIFLAPLSVDGGRVVVGQPINISNSPGYDNQPSFTPDGGSVLFASVRGGGAANIYRYDIASGHVTRVTNTPDRENSPTVMPDHRHISVVRTEADSTQRLWRFALDGSGPQLMLTDVKPVGYYAWADDRTVALFVLGSPATLQVADTRSGKAEVVARGIARSILKVPGRSTVSFVTVEQAQAEGLDPTLWIREFDPATRQVTPLVKAVAGAKEADLAWTPDGMLLMAHAGALYGWRRGDADWTKLADLAALGLRDVTRLAVSARGDRIAVVALPVRQ